MTARSPRPLRRLSVSLVVALLLAASPAWAAPAVVKVFEAAAREAPKPDAAVVHVFPEETKIFVSEEVTDGWRKVRLQDGKTAYVRDDQIKLLPEATEADDEASLLAPAEPTRPAPRPVEPLRPPVVRSRPARAHTTIYVKDLDHLAELVESDTVVHPQAESLASRHKVAMVSLWGGNIVGGVVVIGGVTFLGSKSCTPTGSGSAVCTTSPNLTAMIVGCALALAGTIGWLAITPTRSDLLDVINTWNERHPDEPFTMDRGPGLHD
jgi:hypothetical protein